MSLAGILKEYRDQSSNKLHTLYYNYISKKSALKALTQIEKEKGKLSTKLKNKAYDYAIERLGWKGYAPWLYVYAAIAGSFKEGWIPDNYFHLMVIPRIQGDYGKISFLKPLNNTIFDLSTSPDIAFFINGQWYDKNFSTIGKEVLTNMAFIKSNRVVYKVDQSYQGRGIFFRNKKGFNSMELENMGNGTLQNYIEQHPFFTDLLSQSVATIRMTTIITEDGNPLLCGCYLRLGRAFDTHVKSDSHIRVPIDLVSGELGDKGYMPDWRTTAHHPDSRSQFSDKIVPSYENCVQFVLNLHRRMPMVQCIGWDVIIDSKDQPILMEWNGYGNDIKFSEATQGPCFGKLGWETFGTT